MIYLKVCRLSIINPGIKFQCFLISFEINSSSIKVVICICGMLGTVVTEHRELLTLLGLILTLFSPYFHHILTRF